MAANEMEEYMKVVLEEASKARKKIEALHSLAYINILC
jgi:hypothetical protein